ncbi:CRISPR-associated endonuclease Cas3'' [Clostridium sp. DJ247]|uniref:CRISPR-associated endonuclease Cas3'' n=1 Tax=Clostridium sp. DJ247 TaxID=2726188 RepID=UPI001F4CFCD2|nr:CRISPR-associated endonuclease Cas3'' [Clostridium sp. DJ247]
MYFDNVEIFKIEDCVDNLKNIYAHRSSEDSSAEKEKLTEHIKLTYKYLLFICKQKNLDNVFMNFEKNLLKGKQKNIIHFWKEMLVNTIYMHDIGKINPGFQYDVMKNHLYEDNESGDSNHSLLGSYIYVSYFNRKIKELKFEDSDKVFLRYFMYINSYIISKHHGYLLDFESYKRALVDGIKGYEKEDDFPDLKIDTIKSDIIRTFFYNSFDTIKNSMVKEDSKFNFNVYIYSKLLFSLLTASDYYATSDFMDGQKITDIGIITKELKKKFNDAFNNYKIVKNIREYEKKPVTDGNYKNINQLRSEITLESEKNI